MGLFDRFKKRFKKSAEDEISVDEDSVEAKQASEEGAQMRHSFLSGNTYVRWNPVTDGRNFYKESRVAKHT